MTRRGRSDVALWALAAGMAAAAGLRWSGRPSRPLGIGVQAMTPWLLTPAFPLAAVAVHRRRPALAAAATALGLLQVAALWPDIGHFGGQPMPKGAVGLRIVTANTLLDNDDVPSMAAELLRLRPDVLLLQEITPWNLIELKGTGLFDDFPYQLFDPREGALGSIILSRFPLRDAKAFYIAGRPMTMADVITDAGPVRVINVHAVAPLAGEQIEVWQAQLGELARLRPPGGGHLVLAGDFNASRQNPPFAAMLHAGLRDAFVEAGRGVGNTWPGNLYAIPALMRIDHILVSERVVVTGSRRSPITGSDHHALIADLALPAPQE